jgi:hypothetical protein
MVLRNSALLALLFLLAQPVFSQRRIHWGIKGGIPLTNYFRAAGNPELQKGYDSPTNRYTVGPVVEFVLPSQMGLELGFLYKRQHFTKYSFSSTGALGSLVDVYVHEKTTANLWEVPILLKYHASERPLGTFLEIGGAFHVVSGLRHTTTRYQFTDPPPFPEVPSTDDPSSGRLLHPTNAGIVLGAGLEFRARSIRISPGFRSTLWRFKTFRSVSFATPDALLNSEQSPVEFLMGFTF